jgi:predicted Zn-dependent peptidase
VGTDRKNIRRAIDLVQEQLDAVKRRRVLRPELDRTKSQLKGTMMLGLENMSSRMIRLGSGELYFQKYIPLDIVLRKIDAVTPEAIHEVANDLFQTERFSTVVIRPS